MLILLAALPLVLILGYYILSQRQHDVTWRSFRDRYRRETHVPDSEREIDPTFRFEDLPPSN